MAAIKCCEQANVAYSPRLGIRLRWLFSYVFLLLAPMRLRIFRRFPCVPHLCADASAAIKRRKRSPPDHARRKYQCRRHRQAGQSSQGANERRFHCSGRRSGPEDQFFHGGKQRAALRNSRRARRPARSQHLYQHSRKWRSGPQCHHPLIRYAELPLDFTRDRT